MPDNVSYIPHEQMFTFVSTTHMPMRHDTTALRSTPFMQEWWCDYCHGNNVSEPHIARNCQHCGAPKPRRNPKGDEPLGYFRGRPIYDPAEFAELMRAYGTGLSTSRDLNTP